LTPGKFQNIIRHLLIKNISIPCIEEAKLQMELWDIITKVAGPTVTLIGIILTYFVRRRSEKLSQTLTKALKKNPRARLKDDLEILGMLKGTEHPRYEMVRDHISELVDSVYFPSRSIGPEKEASKWSVLVPSDPVFFILGILALSAFSAWTWYLVRDNFSWWAIGTIFGILMGVGWLAISYEKKEIPDNKQKNTGDATNNLVAK
jgi:hypothetical protein